MSDVQLYLLEKDRDDARRIAKQTALKLEARDMKLISLVESLGGYINDDNLTTRCQSIAYLADVLQALPLRFLTLQQRTLLSDFVISRVQDDPESITPCTQALVNLEARGKWAPETAIKILSTLVESTHPLRRFKVQSERFAVLKLIDLLLADYRSAINIFAQEQPEFVTSFISYFDGEKDPRNLMIVFSILQVPMTEWDLGDNAQELFDSVFNYFPITFKPPPGDPYGITAQDLKNRLRDCISATSAFAPYAFPSLLDKLDSTSLNTKRDVLQALSACINTFDPQSVANHSVTLWEAVKTEIASVQETDIVTDSLHVLTLLSARLSGSHLGVFLKPIFADCKNHMDDAPTKQSQLAGQILASVMRASWDVAEVAIKGTLPNLLALLESSQSASKRRGLLEVMNAILHASHDASSTWQTRDESGLIIHDRAETNVLQSFSVDMFKHLIRAVDATEVSLTVAGLQGLTMLLAIPKLLDTPQIETAVGTATGLTLRGPTVESDEVLDSAIKLLTEAARHYTDVVSSKAVSMLYAQIPDTQVSDELTCGTALESLARLSVEPQIAIVVVQRLKSKLAAALQQSAPQSLIIALLNALLYVFTFGSLALEQSDVEMTYVSTLGRPLLKQALDTQGPLTTPPAVDLVARICLSTIRPLSPHVQNQLYHTDLVPDLRSCMSLDPAARARQVTASLYLHAAFHIDIIQEDKVLQLLDVLKQLVLSDHSHSRSHALRHITVVVNKYVPVGQMSSLLSQAGLDAATLLSDDTNSLPVLRLAFAVAKACLLRTDGRTSTLDFLSAFSTRLDDSNRGQDVAQLFETLLCPDDVLSKSNHCLIFGLYKQRLYAQVHQTVAESVPSTMEKRNRIVALLGVLRWLPYGVFQPTLGSIATSLLQSLDGPSTTSPDEPAQVIAGRTEAQTTRPDAGSRVLTTRTHVVDISALTVLESTLLFDPEILSPHASSLIRRLNVLCAPTCRSPETRTRSLRCLRLTAERFKREIVLPFRKVVVRGLLVALDDGKRDVRAEAVRCRGVWIGLDADDDDDG